MIEKLGLGSRFHALLAGVGWWLVAPQHHPHPAARRCGSRTHPFRRSAPRKNQQKQKTPPVVANAEKARVRAGDFVVKPSSVGADSDTAKHFRTRVSLVANLRRLEPFFRRARKPELGSASIHATREGSGAGRGNRTLMACLKGGNFTAKHTPSTSLLSRTRKGSISLKFPRSAKKPRPVFGNGGDLDSPEPAIILREADCLF